MATLRTGVLLSELPPGHPVQVLLEEGTGRYVAAVRCTAELPDVVFVYLNKWTALSANTAECLESWLQSDGFSLDASGLSH